MIFHDRKKEALSGDSAFDSNLYRTAAEQDDLDSAAHAEQDKVIQDLLQAFDGMTQQLPSLVERWINDHPETSKLVLDGSITKRKIDPALLSEIGFHRVIFMPVANTDQTSGECNAIITANGIVILNDTGMPHSYDLIKSELQNAGVSKIDYVIISHYHGDHVDNLESFIADFDMKDTVYILPKVPDDFSFVSSFPVQNYERTLALMDSNTKIHPDNNYNLSVDDLTLTFFNCSDDDASFYASNTTDYNNYSLCFSVSCGEHIILFTGDIQSLAQDRIVSNGFARKCDVLDLPHHGFDLNSSIDFLLSVRPDTAVFSAADNKLFDSQVLYGFAQQNLHAMHCDLYCTGTNTVHCFFSKDHLFTVGGYDFIPSARSFPFVTIFVDSSCTNSIRNGSSVYPFHSLGEALGFAKTINHRVTIKFLSDYVNADEVVRIEGFKHRVAIDACTIKQCDIFDSFVCLNSVQIVGSVNAALTVYRSTVELNNVSILGDVTGLTDGFGFVAHQSNVLAGSITISNKIVCCYFCDNTKFVVKKLLGENNAYVCKNVDSFGKFYTVSAAFSENVYTSDTTAYADGYANTLRNNDDLDDFVGDGFFVSLSGGVTISLLHRPANIGFSGILTIKRFRPFGSKGGVLQTWKSLETSRNNASSNKTGLFYRVLSLSGTWSPWYQISVSAAE